MILNQLAAAEEYGDVRAERVDAAVVDAVRARQVEAGTELRRRPLRVVEDDVAKVIETAGACRIRPALRGPQQFAARLQAGGLAPVVRIALRGIQSARRGDLCRALVGCYQASTAENTCYL